MTRSVHDQLRRRMLKGLVGTGVAGYTSSYAASALASAGDSDAWKYVLIVDDSASAVGFRRGVEAVLLAQPLHVMRSRLDYRLLNTLSAEMRAPGRRLLGFVDNSIGVLLIDAVRGSGASLRWQAEVALPAHGAVSWAKTLGGQLAALGLGGRSEVSPGHRSAEVPADHVVSFVIESPKEGSHGST